MADKLQRTGTPIGLQNQVGHQTKNHGQDVLKVAINFMFSQTSSFS